MLIYTYNRSKPKRKSKRRPKGPLVQKLDRDKLAKVNSNEIPSYRTPDRNVGVNVSSRDPFKSPLPEVKTQPRYEGEMLERELKAQEELKRKSKQVAPAYNKGPVMFIPEDCVKDIGR